MIRSTTASASDSPADAEGAAVCAHGTQSDVNRQPVLWRPAASGSKLFLVVLDPRQPSRGWVEIPDVGRRPCALGRSGVRLDKHEGDGASPAGIWPLRRVWYRADRLATPPRTALAVRQIRQIDGWCDDVASPDYNRPVELPHGARHERLWRDDAVYDVIVEVGYNDDPPVPPRGSAIFLHVARPGYTPTEGCVALALEDLLALLHICKVGDALQIAPPEAP